MTNFRWVSLVLSIINVICACIYIWAPRRHHHEYADWSEWIEDIHRDIYNVVQAIRYRTCEQCSKVEEQIAGTHHCLDNKFNRPCSHLTLLVGNEAQRVARLEKELGL